MMRVVWKWVVGLLVGFGHALLAQAFVQLQVDQAGVLTGASGAQFSGQTYSVEFVDGSCESVFGGCSKEEYFFEPLDGIQASIALLQQVLVGVFDAIPWRTRGCQGPDQAGFPVCEILLPVGFGEFERQCRDCGIFDIPVVFRVFNTPGLPDLYWVNEWYYDETSDGYYMPSGGEHGIDTRYDPARTWARITPESLNGVPAPSSLILFMAAVLAGLAMRLNRENLGMEMRASTGISWSALVERRLFQRWLRSWLLVCTCALLTSLGTPSRASSIAYYFGGELTHVSDELRPDLEVGMIFSGSFTFDSEQGPVEATSDYASYGLTSFTVSIADRLSIRSLPVDGDIAGGRMGVANRTFHAPWGTFYEDGVDLVCQSTLGSIPCMPYGPLVRGQALYFTYLFMLDATGTTFNDTHFPTTDLNPADFHEMEFGLWFGPCDCEEPKALSRKLLYFSRSDPNNPQAVDAPGTLGCCVALAFVAALGRRHLARCQ